MKRDPHTAFLPLRDELVVDNFAGGGGASTGIEQAFGRPVDVAINHDPEALGLHEINHPATTHYCESVFKVDPEDITGNQPVGLAWFSPDCTHFSKAKGGAPRSPRVRGLAWVVIRWARRVKPRVIMLENVEEFADWGPLLDDGQPCPARRGKTFLLWANQLRAAGYAVEWRMLRACDYGAPTIRKRLFVIARRDGLPIVWPTPTHGPGRQPYRTAAECIDWSLPCPSIFGRSRPLAEATLRRVAAGVMRYVVNAAEPFIVPLRGTSPAHRSVHAIHEPLSTVSAGGTHHALVAPTLAETANGEREGQAPRAMPIDKPFRTVRATGSQGALVAAFLAKHYGGVVGTDLRDPIGTITRVDHHSLVTAELGTDRRDKVAAFLTAYYGSDQDTPLTEPMHTITTRHRFGLVTVAGQQYEITDIGLRMLQPRELYTAQGFPTDYVIDRTPAGPLTKAAQVRMCGNSVSPPLSRALVLANFAHERAWREVA